jgi:hypothetical protein
MSAGWPIAAAALLAATPALAAEPRTVLVFTAGAPASAGPCAGRDARAVRRLHLEKEITSAPGLPPELTECVTDQQEPASTDGGVVAVYAPIGPVVQAVPQPAAGKGRRYVLWVLSNPVAGAEREYERWYVHDHIPGVLRNPGFRTAERFRLVGGAQTLPRFAARYVFDSPDLAASIAEIRRRLSTGETPKSDSFDYGSSINRYYSIAP